MRRQVQARGEGSGPLGGAPAFAFVLFACCAPSRWQAAASSLSTDFTALDQPKSTDQKATLVNPADALGDAKPLARAADKLTSAATPGSSGYKIGPLDMVEFSVFKVPGADANAPRSEEAGAINLPLVGEVQAAGRTAQEVERELVQKLGSQVPAVAAGHRSSSRSTTASA